MMMMILFDANSTPTKRRSLGRSQTSLRSRTSSLGQMQPTLARRLSWSPPLSSWEANAGAASVRRGPRRVPSQGAWPAVAAPSVAAAAAGLYDDDDDDADCAELKSCQPPVAAPAEWCQSTAAAFCKSTPQAGSRVDITGGRIPSCSWQPLQLLPSKCCYCRRRFCRPQTNCWRLLLLTIMAHLQLSLRLCCLEHSSLIITICLPLSGLIGNNCLRRLQEEAQSWPTCPLTNGRGQ